MWLRPEEAATRWPGIRFDNQALYHPDSGRLHADRSVAALKSVAAQRGAVVHHRIQVDQIKVLGDDAVEVHSQEGLTLRARRVVVAAGAWSSKLLEGVVELPRLRVTQEQPAHFASLPTALPVGDWPSLVHAIDQQSPDFGRFHGGVYGLGTPGEGVKVGFHGAGPEVDPDHRDFQPRGELAAALEEYVRAWLPGLDASSALAMSCTYTTTPDSLFVLDRQGPVVVAAGFSGHGFKFVPAIGRVLADLAIDGRRPDPVFGLGRARTIVGGGR